MVSFWPWKADDSSPASFEKALANLSEKIRTSTIRLDSLRQQSRRYGVLWMLYAGFAYLLCSIILVLVVGWRNWGPVEYTAVAGSPILIYSVRLSLTTFYGYRISTLQARVDDLQKQRDSTIRKLKTATKYDSTQELLNRYGGTPTPKPKRAEDSNRKEHPDLGGRGKPLGQRTKFSPPPTANIPNRGISSPAHNVPSPLVPHSAQQQLSSPHLQQLPPQQQSPRAEFAPNAYPTMPQYAPARDGPYWYDRFVDVLLGEDETLPSKRLALICSKCRLVNGQAPPGVKRLEDIGKWRCGSCGTMNGEEINIKQIAENVKEQDADEFVPAKKKSLAEAGRASPLVDENGDSDVTIYTEDEDDTQAALEGPSRSKREKESPTRRSTRKTKMGGKDHSVES